MCETFMIGNLVQKHLRLPLISKQHPFAGAKNEALWVRQALLGLHPKLVLRCHEALKMETAALR